MMKLKKKMIIANTFECFLILGIMLLQYFQLQYSTLGSISKVLHQNGIYILPNILILFLIYLLLSFVLKKGIALIIISIISGIWSIANYYVVNLHGSPLFLSTFANAKTALNVVGGYELEIDKIVIRLLICFILQLTACCIVCFLEKNNYEECKTKTIIKGCLTGVDILCIYFLLLSPWSVVSGQLIQWSWENSVNKYGFVLCLADDLKNSVDPFVEPESYRADLITVEEQQADEKTSNVKPDVILILNETFYDLNLYTNESASEEIFEDFYQIEDANIGYAAVPSLGGGTNNSEYELLVSNSMRLLKNESPFNYINFSATSNNVFEYFNALEYDTYAFHGVDENNYSRKKAYPEMGVENVFLGWDAWDYTAYGNRKRLDKDDYNQIIEQYENTSEAPKFMYLLTYQNHGGWEANDLSYDTVHTENDYGDLTDDINEYLTSVSMSVKAFEELIEYYAENERPVIICMVGDHAPSFINQLPTELSEENKELYARLVPYVIWTNYEVDLPENKEYVSLTDLIPMIVQIADLPLTSYYNTILQLQEEIPVRTSYGKYYDNNLMEIALEADSLASGLLEQYYFMEYNSLKAGGEYKADLFTPIIK